MFRLSSSGLVLAALLAAGCATERANTPLDQADIPKVDFHTHYTHARETLPAFLEAWNMQVVAVNVARGDTAADRATWRAMRAHRAAVPERLLLCTSFDATGIDDPGYAGRVVAQLKQDVAEGAVMVKVWKTFGMVTKDAADRYVQIDDPRLQPIWDYLTGAGIPVLAHIAEPRAAWLPLDPKSPHHAYYENHPEYHAYQNPEVPRWEAIIAARDRWLAQNPGLVVVGAHLGSMAYDVDVVAERLDRHPNFYVDTAARFGDLTSQDSEKVRAFFVKYQDRIVYGTDMGLSTPEAEMTPEALDGEQASMEKLLSLDWQYFTRADSMLYDSPMISSPVRTHGLGLPKDVLLKVYHDNARRLLPR